jgi:hypothetical protein
MTPSPATGPSTSRAPAPDPARVVVVVPRQEIRLHAYLRRSLAAVKDVEVVLDRRATALTPPDDRRRRSSQESERRILICSLVRCPVDLPPAEAAPGQVEPPQQRRTLLWPALRLEHL